MRGALKRHVRVVFWGILGLGTAVVTAMLVILFSPREPMPTRNPGPLPDMPTAAVMDEYLAQMHAGNAAYRATQYTEALQAFEAASRIQPAEFLPYRYLAELYWRTDRKEQAARAVQMTAEAIPDAYFLDQVGSGYREGGLGGLAMHFYKAAIRIDPQFPGAHYNLGLLYLNAGDLQRGTEEMREAIRLFPDFPEAHQGLGMAYTQQGRYEDAIVHLKRALALNPNLPVVRNHLGRIYMAQGRLEEAIQTFHALVDHVPDVAEARHNLAVAYARQGRHELAIQQFEEALRLDPDLHVARLDLATLLLEVRRPEDAIEMLEAALATLAQRDIPNAAMEAVDVHYRLGISYATAGHPQQAIQEFEAVLRVHADHANAHAYLGRLYYQVHRFDQAWRHARRAESLGVSMAQLLAALRQVSVEPR